MISPTRNDAFAMGDQTPDASVRTYADVMREQALARERDNTMQVRHLAIHRMCAGLTVEACHSFVPANSKLPHATSLGLPAM